MQCQDKMQSNDSSEKSLRLYLSDNGLLFIVKKGFKNNSSNTYLNLRGPKMGQCWTMGWNQISMSSQNYLTYPESSQNTYHFQSYKRMLHRNLKNEIFFSKYYLL